MALLGQVLARLHLLFCSCSSTAPTQPGGRKYQYALTRRLHYNNPMTSTNGMFVIVYGPAAEMDEESEAVRREKVSSQPELSAPPFAAALEQAVALLLSAARRAGGGGRAGLPPVPAREERRRRVLRLRALQGPVRRRASSAPLARGCGLQA